MNIVDLQSLVILDEGRSACRSHVNAFVICSSGINMFVLNAYRGPVVRGRPHGGGCGGLEEGR